MCWGCPGRHLEGQEEGDLREGMMAGALADPAERSGAEMTLQSVPKSKQGGWPWCRRPLLWWPPAWARPCLSQWLRRAAAFHSQQLRGRPHLRSEEDMWAALHSISIRSPPLATASPRLTRLVSEENLQHRSMAALLSCPLWNGLSPTCSSAGPRGLGGRDPDHSPEGLGE